MYQPLVLMMVKTNDVVQKLISKRRNVLAREGGGQVFTTQRLFGLGGYS
jgi:hypothetical protein